MTTVGILAYGSLIADPGPEIEPAIVDRIKCETPFKVEFARTSKRRAGAPTLVPYKAGGQVSSELLVVALGSFERLEFARMRQSRRNASARCLN